MFRTKNRPRSGFTLLETMISVAFIAILLIAVGTVSIHVINTYQRGVVIKMVNETRRAISDDIRASLSAGSINLASDYFTAPGYGVLCTGEYTYVWNYAKELSKPNPIVVKYDGAGTASDDTKLRMVKILDRSREYCVLAREYNKIKEKIPLPSTVSGDGKVVEIIKPSENDLMVYDFAITKGASSGPTNQALYQISFSIGTFRYPEIVAAGGQCAASESDLAGCAINRFDVSILTRER